MHTIQHTLLPKVLLEARNFQKYIVHHSKKDVIK